jgi:beta-1,2-mannobiose phosphorylase / 1,2-beta-oligomannan phosphorylase
VHRVSPNIQIDTFDSFDELLDLRRWADYEQRVEASTVLRAAYPWECGKVGGSVPPIRTEDGWLLIYHAVESFPDRPFIYRAGAALLDPRSPSQVIARLPYPILEPEEDYELSGDVNNVVFPVGGYLYDGNLIVSYGAADRCVALATAPLAELLGELRKHRIH